MSADLVGAVERFTAARVHALAIDRDGLPPGLLAGLADLGVFGLTLPEAFGGAGVGLREACAVVRALARADRSVATTVGLHLGLGTRALVRFGSPDAHERWLPDLASGRRVAAFCATEPEAGSDLGAIRTALRDVDGRPVLHGRKSYVTNGAFAGLFTVLARTPGRGGRRAQGLVLVDRGDPGVVVGPEERKLGLRGSSTTPVFFDDVPVGPDRLLGSAGLATALAWGRTLLAAGCVGSADRAIALARAHCAARHQFGRPLDALEVVRERLAELEATRFALEAVMDRATDPDLDDEAHALASIVAKVTCSEGACAVVDGALQLHGGHGFIEDSGLPLLARDVRVARLFEGATDVLLLRAGTALVVRRPPRRGTAPTAAASALEALHADEVGAHGVRLLGRDAALVRLGRLYLEREVGDAVDARAAALGTPAASGCAALWHEGSAARVAALERPPWSGAVVDAVLGP